ncbi:MAG TPA: hypothetical protein PLC42_07180 [Parachlamydiaceae bacterium]|nr:hypothetical protein [Parachlamydiaceae bacterium]
MDANLDKVHSHSRSVQAGSQVVPQEKNEVVESRDCKKGQTVRAKEDKKSHEFGTVSLLYQERSKKAPKSITVHSFNRDLDLRFIAKSEELFSRYVKMQAEMIHHEIKQEREAKYNEAKWQAIKEIFHAQLNELNQKKQQKRIEP